MQLLLAIQSWRARQRATWRPGMYHGHGLRRNFFEGWYFKVVDRAERYVWAIIPGVFLAAAHASTQESHAFVQTLDGTTGVTHYHRYPLAEFEASTTEFDLRIGPNHFRADRLTLAIATAEQSLRGELRFAGTTPWPVTLTSPGIMGWYALVPLMECYHGVLSFDHAITGSLTSQAETVDFNGGSGYIEKD